MKIDVLDDTRYRRFFAFGCSYTNYYWPTWADIIGQNFDFYENWGMKGSGNHYIFNSIVECNQRYQFNSDDLVIVMWTGTTREDRYSNNQWLTAATAYRQDVYGEQWMRRFGVETRGNLIRDFAYITAAQALLLNSGCTSINWSAWPLVRTTSSTQTDWVMAQEQLITGSITANIIEQDVIARYLSMFSNFSRGCLRQHVKRLCNFQDDHPTPSEALEFLRQYLPGDYDLDYVKYWQSQVNSIEMKNTLPVPYNRPIITRL